MTLKEFFRKARRGRKWGLQKSRYSSALQVRCADGLCPMAAVAPRKYTNQWGVISYEDAMKALGFSERTAERIAHAADQPDSPHRKWLLQNLGIRSDD